MAEPVIGPGSRYYTWTDYRRHHPLPSLEMGLAHMPASAFDRDKASFLVQSAFRVRLAGRKTFVLQRRMHKWEVDQWT
jgi:hypothetical protein